MSNPDDESIKLLLLHGGLPVAGAIAGLVASMVADINNPGYGWLQRAGSVVTVLGAYVAYIDATRSFKCIGTTLYINRLPYRIISVILVVVGTVIWGYGDLAYDIFF